MKTLIAAILGLVLAISASGADALAGRLPPTGTWQAAGVPGGIPDTSGWTVVNINTTQSTHIDSTGATSSVTGINNAIAAAGAHTVLTLNAGTYLIDGRISMNRNDVVLRGAADASLANLNGNSTSGLTIFNEISGGLHDVFVGTSSSYSSPTAITGSTDSPGTGADLPAGVTHLTVSSATGFSVGKMVRLLQDNNVTSDVPILGVYANAKVQGQLTMVTGVSGTDITISPALMFPLVAALNPTASCNANIRTDIGLENIYFNGATETSTATAPYAVQFDCAQGCWMKGCQMYQNMQYDFYANYSVQCTIEHNTVWQMRAADGTFTHGPNMAGLKFDASSSNLIWNNILYQQFPGIQINGSSSVTGATENSATCGNVVAYNFSTQAYNAQGYAAADFEDNHGPHTMFDLYEGNACEKWQHDGYYGSGSDITIVRNLITGDNPYSNNNNRAIDLCRFARYYNVVGNLLGSSARSFSYSTTTGSNSAYATYYIYRFGFPGNDNPSYYLTGYSGTTPAEPSVGDWWSDAPAGVPTNAGPNGYGEQDADVEPTTLYKGNCIASSTAIAGVSTLPGIPTGEALGSDTVSNSYFLTSAPGWFHALTWPAYEATSPNYSKTAIPAGYRYLYGVEPPDTPGSPTGLSTGSATVAAITLSWTDAATNETGYQVWRSTDNMTFTLIGTLPPNTSAFTDTGLAPGTTYYYKVRAFVTQGITFYSSYSSAANATTGAAPSSPSSDVNPSATIIQDLP